MAVGKSDIILYASLTSGIGASTPITFGTQPLSDYKFKDTSTFPTPFPIYFESSPSIGVDVFFFSLVGVGLGAGYRILWVMHPMVGVKNKQPDMKKADESVIWYDITSFYTMITLKLAF